MEKVFYHLLSGSLYKYLFPPHQTKSAAFSSSLLFKGGAGGINIGATAHRIGIRAVSTIALRIKVRNPYACLLPLASCLLPLASCLSSHIFVLTKKRTPIQDNHLSSYQRRSIIPFSEGVGNINQ